jgi:hypothetical protein
MVSLNYLQEIAMPEIQAKNCDTFEIGLTMAGAVSGGAYTAGVLDYLIEALDTWQAAKEAEKHIPPEQRTVPTHNVLLCAASGASAGSMCTAILGMALNGKFPHVHWDGASDQNAINGTGNPFFESWVKKIRIEDLLATDDKETSPLPSLLNSQPIDRILQNALKFVGTPVARPWVANPFVARFAITNLRGVSYDIAMKGNTAAGHQMRVHADHFDFKVAAPTGHLWSSKLPELAAATGLAAKPSPTDANWQNFGTAAVASGAFPFALKPRRLERPAADYAHRQWIVAVGTTTATGIPPNPLQDPYGFYCMDGGLTDNEPFELARQVLTGSPWDNNPREGNKATRAVVMIDPFVEDAKVPDDEAGRGKSGKPGEPVKPVKLQDLLMPMLDAWKMQCRFKPAELALAHRDDVYSRYLMAPSRGDTTPLTHPLAAGGLGAFLGFCHESFRIHDYLVGRRNCQSFLQQHFTLPNNNPLIKAGYFDTNNVALPGLAKLRAKSGEWPIIPVVGLLASREEALPSWPAGKFKPETLRELLDARITMVLDALTKEATDTMGTIARFFVRIALSLIKPLVKPKILNVAIEAMDNAVRDQRL